MPKSDESKKLAVRAPKYFVKFRRDANTPTTEYVGAKRSDCTKWPTEALLTDKEDAEDIAAMWRRFLTHAVVEIEAVRSEAS